MSRSSNPDHFFQTSYVLGLQYPHCPIIWPLTPLSRSTSLASAARKKAKSTNTYGNPIKFSSKLLAVLADPTHPHRVYIAESAGNARLVDLDVDLPFPPLTRQA